MKKLTVLLVAGVACAAAFGDVPGTIKTTTGETQKGNIRWSTREKAYVVTKGNIELQVKESDVDVLDIDKPASFDAAVEQVQKGHPRCRRSPRTTSTFSGTRWRAVTLPTRTSPPARQRMR